MSHDRHNRVGLELARRIADGLPSHPEWIDHARRTLERWRTSLGDTPAHRDWDAILDQDVADVIAALLDESEAGHQRRQNSPFAGIVPPQEVWAIKREIRRATG